MKKYRVRLSLLDGKPSVGYNETIPVFLSDMNNPIGKCTIIRTEKGHFGDVELESAVSGELYFYYRDAVTEPVSFYLSGLQFLEEPLKNSSTTKLKDMIVLS